MMHGQRNIKLMFPMFENMQKQQYLCKVIKQNGGTTLWQQKQHFLERIAINCKQNLI